jgi:chromate reductase
VEVTVLAVSGSLRAGSSNGALLRAARHAAPAGMRLQIYGGIGELPHFNPDLDRAPLPESVRAWRDAVGGAAALLISTPEYAHGVPGALKNALDWLVSAEDFAGKPVAIFYGSAGDAHHARAQLAEVLRTMAARVIDDASFSLPGARGKIATDGTVKDPRARGEIERAMAALAASI